MSTRRRSETIEFTPPELEPVARYLRLLCDAGEGWINLLPGVDADAGPDLVPSGLFGLFGNRQEPVSMGTLVPPRKDRQAAEGVTVGLLHPTGGRAVARLAEAGVTLPPGWLVRQDHARRGLVVRARSDAPADEIIGWSIRAGVALCRGEMTGRWQAVVYLP